MKKYIIISGINLHDNNRGTAALSYGAIAFMYKKGLLSPEQTIINIKFVKKIWESKYQSDIIEQITIEGKDWKIVTKHVSFLEKILLLKGGILIPFTTFGRIMGNLDKVAAINGGDGFSDIYNTATFLWRLVDTEIAMKLKIPVIQLPQTLGPFKSKKNYEIAKKILRYSKQVFVRDDKFIKELNEMDVSYELTRDLSYYMKPQPWNIEIKDHAIGINVSGLAYSNKFRTLSGEFDQYPNLINQLIEHFQKKGNTIYLIPHSYNYEKPEENNDDIVACCEAYNMLQSKSKVVLINQNLTSPQIKYLISKMNFFIGTRMHANFAAIYSNVPLFGLAYSYKFEGAFNANGLNGKEQTAIINNITREDIPNIINKIEHFYLKNK